MSDEKRQTRLLPFRLRRAGTRDARAGRTDDFEADAELTALLRVWEAPPRDESARGRLLADFRASVRPAPLWRRALTAELRIPLPVAACAAAVMLLSLYALGARALTTRGASAEVQAAPEAAVRVVEVPVVQERVVTRTVYVEKKERGAAPAVYQRKPEREALASETTTQRDDAQKDERPAPERDAHAGYFTRVDMNDFQPSEELKIRIVSRGGENEK